MAVPNRKTDAFFVKLKDFRLELNRRPAGMGKEKSPGESFAPARRPVADDYGVNTMDHQQTFHPRDTSENDVDLHSKMALTAEEIATIRADKSARLVAVGASNMTRLAEVYGGIDAASILANCNARVFKPD